MDRWGYFVGSGVIHRDWRSHPIPLMSPQTGLGREEMKKIKVSPKKSETKKRDIPIIVKGAVVSPREHDDFIGRDPRSVR
jgi:hypothetical protein